MNELVPISTIENRIYTIRGVQVMIDRDIAELYGVETRRINEQVKRNQERFPESFCFQLNEIEFESLMSQNAISNMNSNRGGVRKLPYAFTEQGVAMLSSVLKSKQAVAVSVRIIEAFVAMRRFLLTNAQVFQRLDSIERHQLDSDKRIDELFNLMDKYGVNDEQGIFFQGQIFDAYALFQNIIQKAEKEILLIDNYVDTSVLKRFSVKKDNVAVTIYTKKNSRMANPITEIDLQKFNAQYPTVTLKYTSTMHDRYMIIDKKELYHIGASLKDLGKACFSFTKMNDAKSMIQLIMNNL